MEKWNALRDQMPVLKDVSYLNTGTAGPLSETVVKAMTQSLDHQRARGRIDSAHYDELGRHKALAREGVASILHCEPSEIALTRNTGEGVNIASLGINWQPGDEVLTTDGEHLAVLMPLYVARERFGITLSIVELAGKAEDAVHILEERITPRTRLISLSHVSYSTGEVLPIQEICSMARRFGILSLVDGAQSFAAMPVNVRELGCDFYAVPGQKWVCGPEGTGALYVRREVMTQLRLLFTGYSTAAHYSLFGGFTPKETAERFEQGTVQPADVAGFAAACKWFIHEVGPGAAYARISRLANCAIARLAEIGGVRVRTPENSHAGLVAFTVDGEDPNEVVKKLRERGVALRSIPYPEGLRIATGFYNDESDIDELIDGLRSVTAEKRS